MKFYDGELFLTIGQAASFVSGREDVDWIEESFDPTLTKYQDILASELRTYVYLNGLHEYQMQGTGGVATLHMQGFCTQINFPQGDVYEAGNYLDIATIFSLGDERILDIERFPTLYVTLTELHNYHLTTGYKLSEVNFQRFFEEALGCSGLALAEQAAEENGKTDEALLIEEIKERSYFSYLIKTFGENREKVAHTVLLYLLDRHIRTKVTLEKSPTNEETPGISNTDLSDELIMDYPEYLKLAISVYKNIWQGNPAT